MGDCTVFTILETMKILKISRSTLMNLLVSKKLKSSRAGARYLISSDAIKEFLKGA